MVRFSNRIQEIVREQFQLILIDLMVHYSPAEMCKMVHMRAPDKITSRLEKKTKHFIYTMLDTNLDYILDSDIGLVYDGKFPIERMIPQNAILHFEHCIVCAK